MRRPVWPPRAAWRFLVAQGLALEALVMLHVYSMSSHRLLRTNSLRPFT
jgi:hypothetical protein